MLQPNTNDSQYRYYLSICIPIYNEEDNIEPLLLQIINTLSSLQINWEIILVDDGSTDGSFAKISEMKHKHSLASLTAIRFANNCGQTSAIAAGIKMAQGKYILTMDGDLQNDPSDIPKLLSIIENEECDAVIGWRKERKDNIIRKISSKIANRFRQIILNDSIKDIGCSLKIFKSTAIKNIPLFEGMHRFLPILITLNNGKVLQIEVKHNPRTKGKSKYNIFNRLFRALADLLAVKWMKMRWINYKIIDKI